MHLCASLQCPAFWAERILGLFHGRWVNNDERWGKWGRLRIQYCYSWEKRTHSFSTSYPSNGPLSLRMSVPPARGPMLRSGWVPFSCGCWKMIRWATIKGLSLPKKKMEECMLLSGDIFFVPCQCSASEPHRLNSGATRGCRSVWY